MESAARPNDNPACRLSRLAGVPEPVIRRMHMGRGRIHAILDAIQSRNPAQASMILEFRNEAGYMAYRMVMAIRRALADAPASSSGRAQRPLDSIGLYRQSARQLFRTIHLYYDNRHPCVTERLGRC